ncbi:MAG: BRO family protein [Candidatus Gracilibacteria bacterium]|nr:BRO family protein [Candidatus Gracilibacteria bacterium]
MQNNKNITLFDYKNVKVRTVIIDGDVWFVAKDVCDILEIKNPTDALSNLSERMKMTLEGKESILGITEDPNVVRILLVSEPGMYKLVFKSRKPEAEKFSDWVVCEVLPTIRKTGSYGTTKSLSPMMMRFSLNSKQNSTLGYWSMLNKMVELFALPLEHNGFELPENIIPDISTGILFNKYIKSKGYNPEKICKTYTHIYPDGRQIPGVRQYPDSLYPLFTQWFQKEWLAKRCAKYIIERTDDHVLPYLENTFPHVIYYKEQNKLESKK